MKEKQKDDGVILVSLQHFELQVLPRMEEIKQKLDDGGSMHEFDIEFLTEALHDMQNFLPHLDDHPDYKTLFCQVTHYYKTITDEALENAK